jgi:hypothetical protein
MPEDGAMQALSDYRCVAALRRCSPLMGARSGHGGSAFRMLPPEPFSSRSIQPTAMRLGSAAGFPADTGRSGLMF